MKHANGFTLVELMIVVVIISILSVVAMPAYTDYVMKGKIPDATSNLAAKRVKMEQWFQDNRRYDTAAGQAPCTNTGSNGQPLSQYFTFSCTIPDTTHYTITATGAGSMNGFVYTIDQDNNKTSNAPGDWGPNSTTCWITGKGGKC